MRITAASGAGLAAYLVSSAAMSLAAFCAFLTITVEPPPNSDGDVSALISPAASAERLQVVQVSPAVAAARFRRERGPGLRDRLPHGPVDEELLLAHDQGDGRVRSHGGKHAMSRQGQRLLSRTDRGDSPPSDSPDWRWSRTSMRTDYTTVTRRARVWHRLLPEIKPDGCFVRGERCPRKGHVRRPVGGSARPDGTHRRNARPGGAGAR